MRDDEILAIAEALRVAYLRGSDDPQREDMTETIHELRDFVVRKLSTAQVGGGDSHDQQ